MTDTSKYSYEHDHSLSDKWKFRFDFFEKNGTPGFWRNPPAWVQAFKALKFSDRVKVNMNFIGAFFSFFYLFYLGLWKKALLIIAVMFVCNIIAAMIGWWGIGIVGKVLCAMRVNIWYYQLRVHNIHDWSI